ncbi:hypothetical protein Purlil1_255 [Purpureocillium lilacinum]|uniref:CENP-V/GFA domain-containing protein n=1 Tax=Purpureocillium lilacinum TaxID=33203 RepID=A0ABR0CGC9_PURLI|nr:hypothetical protein Purlil1_255 [Purpureocillium lilacinum]
MRFQALMAIPAATVSSRHFASAVASTPPLYTDGPEHAYFTAIGCRDTNSNVMDARIDLNGCIATGSDNLVPGQGFLGKCRDLEVSETTLCAAGLYASRRGPKRELQVPLSCFQYVQGTAHKFTQDNGVTREFCNTCGVFICEYGEQAADKFRYVMWGTMSEPDTFPPKGEFFCKNRANWMPEISVAVATLSTIGMHMLHRELFFFFTFVASLVSAQH